MKSMLYGSTDGSGFNDEHVIPSKGEWDTLVWLVTEQRVLLEKLLDTVDVNLSSLEKLFDVVRTSV